MRLSSHTGLVTSSPPLAKLLYLRCIRVSALSAKNLQPQPQPFDNSSKFNLATPPRVLLLLPPRPRDHFRRLPLLPVLPLHRPRLVLLRVLLPRHRLPLIPVLPRHRRRLPLLPVLLHHRHLLVRPPQLVAPNLWLVRVHRPHLLHRRQHHA